MFLKILLLGDKITSQSRKKIYRRFSQLILSAKQFVWRDGICKNVIKFIFNQRLFLLFFTTAISYLSGYSEDVCLPAQQRHSNDKPMLVFASMTA